MKELAIDNKIIFIDEKTKVALNFKCSNIGEFKINGSGSYTIKLSKYDKDVISIFEYCNDVTIRSDFAYILHGAVYYEDGHMLFDNANLYVTKVTTDDMEIILTWGNSPAIQLLKTKQMYNYDMGVQDFPTSANDAAIYLYEACKYYVYDNPLYPNGVERWTSFVGLMQGNPTIDRFKQKYLRPAIKLKNALDSLFNIAGLNYSIENTELSSMFDSVIIPTIINKVRISNKFTYSLNRPIANYRLTGYNWVKVAQALGCSSVLPEKSTLAIINQSNIITPGGANRPQFNVPKTGQYNIKLTAKYSQMASVNKSSNMTVILGRANPLQSQINNTTAFFGLPEHLNEVGGVAFSQYGVNYVFNFDAINAQSGITKTMENVYLSAGDYGLSFFGQGHSDAFPGMIPPLQETTYDFTYWNVNFLIEFELIDSNPIDLTPIDYTKYYYNDALTFSNLTAFDLLQGILQSFGLFSQMKGNSVKLFTFKDVIDNMQFAKDWSDKVFDIIPDELSFDIGLTAQNKIAWKEEEQYLGTQDFVFTILNKNTTVITDYIKNSVFSSLDWWTENVAGQPGITRNYPCVQWVKPNGESYDGNLKLLQVAELINQVYIVDEDNNVLYTANNRCYNTDFKNFNYNNPNGFIKFIQPLLKSLERTKIVTYKMWLSPQDIQELDYSVPVYIQQDNAYYFILEINGYEIDNYCKVTLLKIEL